MTHYQDFQPRPQETIKNHTYSYGQTNGGGDIKGLLFALVIICLGVMAIALLAGAGPEKQTANNTSALQPLSDTPAVYGKDQSRQLPNQ